MRDSVPQGGCLPSLPAIVRTGWALFPVKTSATMASNQPPPRVTIMSWNTGRVQRLTQDTLRDIIEAIESAEKFLPESRKELDSDRRTQLALTRLAEVVSESAGMVPDSVRSEHPEVSWNAATRIRDRVLPNHADPDLDALWEIVTGDLRTLLPEVRDVLAALPPAS